MKRNAFTLLELLLANMLVAILLAALFLVISSLSREKKSLAPGQQQDSTGSILNLLRQDLSNSESARPLPNQRGMILTGHVSLDPKSLTPTDRRARVIYEIRRRAGTLCLIREQTYIDDAAKPLRWEELIATNVTFLAISSANESQPIDDEAVNIDDTTAFTVPSSVTIHLGLPHRTIDQEIFLR
ncbi:MAG TPA: hypothetical protein VGQ99_21650 [Tepidisphaeraceae bacterium]|nr:hypothetical protein [Tepidisphaeraceae bacterium]